KPNSRPSVLSMRTQARQWHNARMASVLLILLKLLVSVLIGLPAAWGTVALWYQAGPGRAGRWLMASLWVVLGLGALALVWQDPPALSLFSSALLSALLLVWWQSIPPTHARVWADDVARMTHGEVAGERVVLHEVRNFRWRTREEHEARWETRHYDL